MPQLAYDVRDDKLFEQRGMRNLYWLDDLDAVPLPELDPNVESFLYAGARPIADYRKLTATYPEIKDTAAARLPLLNLDSVLSRLEQQSIDVAAPKTWIWELDRPVPNGIQYPVFVRAAKSSWKLGGKISKVMSERELQSEAFELRRAFGYDQSILAREWLDIVPAGESAYGPVPMEIRTWIVDSIPYAWSFHHLQIVQNSTLFPLSDQDTDCLYQMASKISCFESRLVCVDFVKTVNGAWRFLEAGPGSCAGTAHEYVFKAVAAKLAGKTLEVTTCSPDNYGKLFRVA